VDGESDPILTGPTVDDLLARKGWLIEDPHPRHARNPSAFWLPGDELRAAIAAGSQVRLLLWFIDEDGPDQLVAQCERMWALVETREGDLIHGRLTSPPISVRAPLEMGSQINFRSDDAIDVLDPEPDWRDHRDFLQAVFEGDEAFEEWKRSRPANPKADDG
jgi:hypothetical protein